MKKVQIESPVKDLENYKKELLSLRIKRASGDSVPSHRFRELRKLVARCFTMLGVSK